MANVTLIFSGTEQSGTNEHKLQLFANTNNEIYINISMPGWEDSFICMDKKTAIKLHRELKKHISYLSEESEVIDG